MAASDERLHTFDTDILDDDTPYQPRIVNAKVYHERTPVAYWPRLHKPEWINHINRWDAYIYDTPEPPRTDRITIIHRHDLRSREYRESKYHHTRECMDGECPWCDEGPFERPEMHARQKHESEYESYSESE